MIRKLLQLWRYLRSLLSPDGFAQASVWEQLGTIFVFGAMVILFLSPALGDISTSYRIFADPSSFADAEGPIQVFFGLVQMIFGLVLFSFIVSVLSAALVELVANIKGGKLPYRKGGHILIVNHNVKLPLILDEFNMRAQRKDVVEDVVLLCSEPEIVSNFHEHLDTARWSHLEIYIRQGDLLSFSTFERQGIMKALAVVILLPDHVEDEFAADNYNLKLLTTLVNKPEFFQHLSDCQKRHQPVKCSVELSGDTHCRDIALSITTKDAVPLFAVITPNDVIGHVIARAMVDVVYYNVFFEALSFEGTNALFVDPARFGALDIAQQVKFDQLLFEFSGGLLIGYSSVDSDGRFHLKLCPFGEAPAPSDWLLFLTEDADALQYTPQEAQALVPHPDITPPSEQSRRQLCVIGDAWKIGPVMRFIDTQSQDFLLKSHFVFDRPEDYFAPEFQQTLRAGGYDNIIINLDDELGFRLTMLLFAIPENNKAFRAKFVTVLKDPQVEKLLNERAIHCKTLLSHKLAAKYIAQLSFQKSLEILFTELTFPEGAEFNLLEVGTHIPQTLLHSTVDLKHLLAAHQMIYVGIVDAEKRIFLNATDMTNAQQILALSKGTV
ncbi:MAG: hypothetical protein KDI28_06650 [Pseudomonadales bacterium]|nr:hypothetical protein [Pseudomonadales bacterium]